MKALYPHAAARIRVRPLLPLMALAAASILATVPGKALARLTQASIASSPGSASVLLADGGCRYAITGKALDGDANLVPNTTLHFALTCSPSGNATLSATTVSTSTGQGTVYVTGSSHCTISVSVWADDGARETSVVSTPNLYFVTGHWNPVTVNGVTSNGPPELVSAGGTGSGSFSLSGQYHWGSFALRAGYDINGYSDSSSILSASRNGTPTLTGYTCIDAYGSTVGYWDNTENAASNGNSACRWGNTWVPDTLSNSGVPKGFYLRATLSEDAYATHTMASGVANGTSGSGSTPITVSASGTGTAVDDKWGITTSVVDHLITSSYQEITANIYAAASSTSNADYEVTDDSGSTECVDTATVELILPHQHVNAN